MGVTRFCRSVLPRNASVQGLPHARSEGWTSGKLAKLYPGVNGLKPLASDYINGITLAKYVYPVKTRGDRGPELFSTAPNVEPIRFHDGRATFCTWARRAGKSETWIKERTGYTPSSGTLDRYTRMAQTLSDLEYEAFPDVSSAVPELAELLQQHPELSTSQETPDHSERGNAAKFPKSKECEGGDLNPDGSNPASTSS